MNIKFYIQIKRNRSLNTTNGLLAKMESSYVTTYTSYDPPTRQVDDEISII